MKRILLLASLLAFAAGCAKTEIETAVTTVGETVPQGNATFTAVIADAAKASVDPSSGKFAWQAGDAVSVWVTGGSEGRFVTFTLVGTGGEASGKFSGTLAEGEAMTDFAVYPAGAHKYSGGTLSVNYPSEFAWTEGVVPTVMVAQIAAGSESMSFRHVGGVVSVTVDNVPASATKFSFQAPASTGITGDFVYDGTQVAASGEAADEVTVTFPAGTASQMTFYIPVPVVTLSGLTVSLATNSHTIAKSVKTATSSNSISRATLLKMPAYTVPGPVFYVKADNNTGDGSSWDKATTLTKALAMAEDGDEVRVAAGTYVPDTQIPRKDGTTDDKWKCFLVDANITLTGGYPAGGGDLADPANTTTLDGNGGYHALAVAVYPNGTDSVTIRNLTLKGGEAGSSSLPALSRDGRDVTNAGGSAVSSQYARILFKDCKIQDYSTSRSLFYNVSSASTTLDGCVLSGNSVGHTGLLYNNYKMYIVDTEISDNTTNNATYGVVTNNHTMEIRRSRITGNTAPNFGGGLSNRAGTLYVEDSFIGSNQITATSGAGGAGVYNHTDATLTMVRDTVDSNSGYQGAGIYNLGTLTVRGGRISENTATSYGAAFYEKDGAEAQFEDVILYHNQGAGPVFLYCTSADAATKATFTGCQFLNNTSGSKNGGCLWSSASHVVLDGCLFSRNSGNLASALYNYDTRKDINDPGYLYVYNTVFTGNTSTTRATAYLRESSRNVFVNCSFYGNTAATGTGISVYSDSQTYVVNTTITGNTANVNTSTTGNGAGFELVSNNSVAHLLNSLVSGNSSARVPSTSGSNQDISYPSTKRLTSCEGTVLGAELFSAVDTPVSGWTFDAATMFGSLNATWGVYPVVSVLSGGVETNPAMAQGMGKAELQAIDPGFAVGSIDAAKLGVDIAGNERSGKVIGAYVGQ